jgi:hypothetical protein
MYSKECTRPAHAEDYRSGCCSVTVKERQGLIRSADLALQTTNRFLSRGVSILYQGLITKENPEYPQGHEQKLIAPVGCQR